MARTHTVRQGEYLARIAEVYGFSDWKYIYEHPLNEALRAKRPRPDVLFPGDLVQIPDTRTRTFQVATNQRHRFQLQSSNRNRLTVFLKDDRGEALSKVGYTLNYRSRGEDFAVEGTTNSDGKVEHDLPLDVECASLKLTRPHLSWELHIGHLDPADPSAGDTERITAVQARLNNLGFPCGRVDGVVGPRTRAALKEFQRKSMKLSEPSAELDDATCAALIDHYGC